MSFWTVQFATIALIQILLIFSFVHHVQCSESNAPEMKAHEFHPLQQITRRQANPTDQDIAYCESIMNEVYCSSGLAQDTVDFILGCGETTETSLELTTLIPMCSKSETGAFCISLSRSILIMTENFVENCGSDIIIMFNSSSCPPKCRSQLEDLKSSLGCCINNPLLNRMFSSVYFNYRLWNFCDVPLPPMDCENGLILNTPATIQSCDINTFVEFQLDSYSVFRYW
jgi:hypothetical protein